MIALIVIDKEINHPKEFSEVDFDYKIYDQLLTCLPSSLVLCLN